MKKILLIILGLILIVGIYFGAKFMGVGYKKVTETPLEVPEWKSTGEVTNENYMTYVDEYDINKDTSSLGGAQSKFYSKFIEYTALNGKPIRIVAMDKVTDDQMLYAYNLLSFYLKHVGDDVANQMAINKSVLILPNGADKDGKTPAAALALGQNLNQMEIANIGSAWYINNNYEHRDAAFEEIFHMVHDYGIGTSKNKQASPEISKLIADAEKNALPTDNSKWGNEGLWGLSSKSWLDELAKEGSLEQEYIASVIDSYYGLWEPWTEGQGGMWGIYVAKTRDEIASKDPNGLKTIESILPSAIDQMMRIDPTFKGDFYMTKDESKPYTFKSQYLKNITLTGKENSNILANDLDNVLMGNSGTNTIDGGNGYDVFQLKGKLEEYIIEEDDGLITVTDSVSGRDGVNILKNIEVIRAIDEDYDISNE
ncbi:hypothetical protein EZV73_24940 [Acidaminobacter sp. JC074]|uniref:hypothetical protein n=1 Tax=Acidaminobacter sp. JC074 TaxID=2530199 RepID=UPI001F10B01F|nr:hypothetical protein [Acidaminobacter sp. JC074]MCH4890850.1 hypothetical protein [Acidaminobacter sp. JC074]